MVDVRIFGPLWEHLEPRMELDLEPSRELDHGGRIITVEDLLARLEVDVSEVGIVTVDGRQSGLEASIPADSRVCIFPPMSGG